MTMSVERAKCEVCKRMVGGDMQAHLDLHTANGDKLLKNLPEDLPDISGGENPDYTGVRKTPTAERRDEPDNGETDVEETIEQEVVEV